MDPGASDLANPYAESLRGSSLSSPTSGSLLHHMKNRLVKNLGILLQAAPPLKPSTFQASRQGKQQTVAPLNA